MQPQDDRSLWDLLDHARQPRVPGNFADNVLRRIRLEATDPPAFAFRLWLAQSWKMMSGLTAGAALLATAVLFQETHPPGLTSTNLAGNFAPDISTLLADAQISDINELGDLDSTLDDNDIWLGTTSY